MPVYPDSFGLRGLQIAGLWDASDKYPWELYDQIIQLSINQLEETKFNRSQSELQDNEADNASPNLDVKQEDILSTNDRLLPISYHQNEDETPHYPSQVEP